MYNVPPLFSPMPPPLQSQKKGKDHPPPGSPSHHRLPSDQTTLFATSLQWVEAIALVALCSYRPVTRRVSLMILKEVRQLREVIGHSVAGEDANVMDVIDKAAPVIIARHIDTLMPSEKVGAVTLWGGRESFRRFMKCTEFMWLQLEVHKLIELPQYWNM